MKEVNELLVFLGKTKIKNFIIALSIMFIWVFLYVYGWTSNTFKLLTFERNGWLDIRYLVILFLLILYRMHSKRFKSILQEGSFNRIRLLPIPKMSIVYSELLYVGATYVMMMFVVGFAWILAWFLGTGGNLEQLIFDISSNATLYAYIPFTWITILYWILLLATWTYTTTLLLLSGHDSDRKTSSRIVVVIALVICFILNSIANVQYPVFSFTILKTISCVEMIIIIVYCHITLRKYFGRKGRSK